MPENIFTDALDNISTVLDRDSATMQDQTYREIYDQLRRLYDHNEREQNNAKHIGTSPKEDLINKIYSIPEFRELNIPLHELLFTNPYAAHIANTHLEAVNFVLVFKEGYHFSRCGTFRTAYVGWNMYNDEEIMALHDLDRYEPVTEKTKYIALIRDETLTRIVFYGRF